MAISFVHLLPYASCESFVPLSFTAAVSFLGSLPVLTRGLLYHVLPGPPLQAIRALGSRTCGYHFSTFRFRGRANDYQDFVSQVHREFVSLADVSRTTHDVPLWCITAADVPPVIPPLCSSPRLTRESMSCTPCQISR